MPQIPGNLAEVGQNHHARKSVSANLSVLKWIRAIFLPRSSKVTVQNVLLCPFQCEPRLSGVSLKSAGLKNIPQVSGNRAEVRENHDARKVVSATLSVLKWSRAISRPRSSKMSVQKALLCPFHCKRRLPGNNLESPGLENIPEIPVNWSEISQNHNSHKPVSATLYLLE